MTNPLNSPSPLPIAGPWTTKSNGQLSVLFDFGKSETAEFTKTLDDELGGLRAYRVTGLKQGAVGANEWHKVRTEIAFVTRGSATWTLVAKDGSESTIRTDPQTQGLIIPPNTLHTYHVGEDETEILVITNTTFNPNAPSTHDTYPCDTFSTL